MAKTSPMNDGRSPTKRILSVVQSIQNAHRDNCAYVRLPVGEASLLARDYMRLQSENAQLQIELVSYRSLTMRATADTQPDKWVIKTLHDAGVE